MASVYLAEDNELPRQVALKLLPNQFIADKQLTERFFREARAAAKLEHPNIILIYEASVFEGQPFIAMQFIDGPTVADLISAKGKIEIEESVSIICKVLETLEAAHNKGIFHRDIKPTNVMLKDGKYVRVIDFGIAKAQTDSNLTAAGTAFGTPAYMAPEQFSSSADANAALYDVYAVGVTFYYMLCGKLPFEGDNPYTIRDLKIYKKPVSPSSMASNIPPALDEVVMKAMAANPKDRYQSAQEMFDAIHNALKASQTAIIDLKEDPAVLKKRAGIKKSKPKWPIGLAAALALIAAGYFGYQYFGKDKADGNSGTTDTISNDGVPELVAVPKLLLPTDDATITNTDMPRFVWNASVEAGGSYVLEHSSNQNFSPAVRNAGLTDTVYNPPTGLANGTYFWRVQGVNKNSQSGDFSRPQSFAIDKTVTPVTAGEGIISITINEPSSVLIDGKMVKTNTKSWEDNIRTGRHAVRVENQASVEKALGATLDVEKGKRASKSFDFTFAKKTSELVVLAPAYPSEIFIDGSKYPERTPKTITIEPGEHEIKVVRDDNGKELKKDVVLVAGKKYRILFDYQGNTSSFEVD